MCGVTDFTDRNHEVILPPSVVNELHEIPVVSVVASITECTSDDAESVNVVNESNDESEWQNVDDVLLGVDTSVECDVNQLFVEQKADISLESCWTQAKESKGNFVIYRDLLYHQNKVEGKMVSQLCVSKCRRDKVLELAHDSIFGGHMGERKTRERIRLSFY